MPMNICKSHMICKKEMYAILLGHVAFSDSILFCHCQGVENILVQKPTGTVYCRGSSVTLSIDVYFKLT